VQTRKQGDRLFEWRAGFDPTGLKVVKMAKFDKSLFLWLVVKGTLSVPPERIRR